MRIVFAWQWENTLDVIVRFDEGVGEVLRNFAAAGHEVWCMPWGEGATGSDQGVNFHLCPPSLGFDGWAEQIAKHEPDIVLGWGSIDHKIYPAIKKALPSVPMFYFLAGGAVNHPTTQLFESFFVETQFHVEDLNKFGKPAVKALGVMDSILYPIEQLKQWDVILPAAFTGNKRYDLFSLAKSQGGFTGVAVGYKNDQECWEQCKKANIPTFGYVSREVLRDFYCASRVTVLTGGSWGGSQRTLLESLCCGVPVVACDDNFQLDWLMAEGAPISLVPPNSEFIIQAVKKYIDNPPNPETLRQFVIDKFTGKHYYETVRAEIIRILDDRGISHDL